MFITFNAKPVSVNHVYGHKAIGKRVLKYLTKESKEFRKEIISQLNKQMPNAEIIFKGDIEVTVIFTFGDHRKHDIDDYSKVLLDSLNGLLWADDGQIVTLKMHKIYKKGVNQIEFWWWKK